MYSLENRDTSHNYNLKQKIGCFPINVDKIDKPR